MVSAQSVGQVRQMYPRNLFRTMSNIYDRAFLQKYLTGVKR